MIFLFQYKKYRFLGQKLILNYNSIVIQNKKHLQMSHTFQLQSLIFVTILIIYVLASHLIETRKVPYLHESAIAIMMGMLTALFVKYVLGSSISFSNEIFFAIILPPIIFSAGYSLRKSLFFQNIGIASFLGVLGTIIGFLSLTFFLILVNKLIFRDLHLVELMMISSVLCATDTVAALSLVKPSVYPVLNAVLCGQSILNDAVAIILFRTVAELDLGESGQLTFEHVLGMIISFSYLFIGSITLGMVTGFGLTYLFKIKDSFSKHPIKQSSLILLNGYFAYLFGQLLSLSGIITLFTCAVIMGHYTFKNISQQSQRGTGLAFETVSHIAQAFVFAYLGSSVFSIHGKWAALGLSVIILLILPLIRAIMVYFLPLVYKIIGKKFPMSSQQLKICWYSGLIRGVIAFALCLQIKSSKSRDFIVTVTLVIVMLTTLIGSTMMKQFAKFIGMQDQKQQIEDMIPFRSLKQIKMSQSQIQPSSNYKSIQVINNIKTTQGQHQPIEITKSKNFQWFENQYIKPIFQKKHQKLSYQLQIKDYPKQPQLISNYSKGSNSPS